MRLGLGLGLGLSRAQSQRRNNDMILVYEIPAPTNIELAIQANSRWFSAGQAVVINWGDGSAVETVSDTGGDTYIGHTYTAVGTYKVKISGSMTMYGRSSGVDIAGQELLTRIDSFGKLGITSLAYAFYNCSGDAFNPDVSNWDVRNVTDMRYMFSGCRGSEFNPDVSNWDVSNVTNMRAMFRYCSGDAFNPVVSNWDVSNVTNMRYMFSGCRGSEFNPDVSNWDVSNVTDMYRMFQNCSGDAFNPDMKSWTLKTGVTATNMFLASRTQPTEWLDELLVAWAANPAQGDDITIDFSPNKFTVDDGGEPLSAVADALEYLTNKGWNITTANPYSST